MGGNNTGVRISIKVMPNAGRNEIIGLTDGIWRIKVAAAPEKGKANRELLSFLREVLGTKKDNLGVIKGQTSHIKVLQIEGLTEEEVFARLSHENLEPKRH
jgi:uncharacterized protein (TIGR00251 family)